MRAADLSAVAAEAPAPLIRIRHLLVLAIVGGLCWIGVPRMRAAWALHSAGSTLANYALCMVGPTGPAALRDNPREFWKMVRRRLVTSEAVERPFVDCGDAAGELTGSHAVEHAHGAAAGDFVEFGGPAADRAQRGSTEELSVASLLVTTRPLARLAEQAHPFVRGGYTHLVQPSSHAREAVHPVALPRPLVGRGLPAWGALYEATSVDGDSVVVTMGQGANQSVYRSQDGGVTWKVASLGEPAVQAIGGRCPAGDQGAYFRFGVSVDRTFKTVRSITADGSESRARLAPVGARVFAASCDETAMAVLAGAEGSRDASLLVCVFQGDCREVRLPTFGEASPRYPLDVARLQGVTTIATSMHGIVRVTSSRDDGSTWAPWTVAYDPRAHEDLAVSPVAPTHLLAVGKRMALYGGGASSDTTYPVLFSEDFGASWRGM